MIVWLLPLNRHARRKRIQDPVAELEIRLQLSFYSVAEKTVIYHIGVADRLGDIGDGLRFVDGALQNAVFDDAVVGHRLDHDFVSFFGNVFTETESLLREGEKLVALALERAGGA